MNLIKFLTSDRGIVLPPQLNEFNWGAFLFTFIWGIRFRVWITLLAIPLILVQMPLKLNWILYLLLQFYCGFNGNNWAYQTLHNKSAAEFRKQQEYWGIAAISCYIVIPLIFLNLLVKFVKKSPDNLNDFINNSQCKLVYEKLNKGLDNSYTGNTSTEIAQNFAKKFKNTQVQGQSVIFKSSKSRIKNYVLSFNIYPEISKCSYIEKNCTITAENTAPIGTSIHKNCMFYIDSRKKIIPEEHTLENLKKGYNIFKYL